MSNVQKFLFDRSFDDDPTVRLHKPKDQNGQAEAEMAESQEVEQTAPEPEPEEPSFSEDDLRMARAEGYEQGRQEGLNQATDAHTQIVAATLGQIAQHMGQLFADRLADREQAMHDGVAVASVISRKLLPDLSAKNALGEVTRVVEEALDLTFDEPKLTIWLHPSLAEDMAGYLREAASQAVQAGGVAIVVDENLPPGDCKVEWADGAAYRDTAAIWQQIDEVIERHLAGTEGTLGEPPEPEPEPEIEDEAEAETGEEAEAREVEKEKEASEERPEPDQAEPEDEGEDGEPVEPSEPDTEAEADPEPETAEAPEESSEEPEEQPEADAMEEPSLEEGVTELEPVDYDQMFSAEELAEIEEAAKLGQTGSLEESFSHQEMDDIQAARDLVEGLSAAAEAEAGQVDDTLSDQDAPEMSAAEEPSDAQAEDKTETTAPEDSTGDAPEGTHDKLEDESPEMDFETNQDLSEPESQG